MVARRRVRRQLSTRQFSKALDRNRREVPEIALNFQKKVTAFALDRIVRNTPVRTGLARGNWQVGTSINSRRLGNLDPSGQATISTGLAAIARAQIPFGNLFIFNNVDYIGDLENGSSAQAPNGMIAAARADIAAFAALIANSEDFSV